MKRIGFILLICTLSILFFTACGLFRKKSAEKKVDPNALQLGIAIRVPGLAAVPYYWHPPLSGDSGLGYIFFFGLLFFTSTILGGLLALIAFARREPYLLFPCLGFLISAVLLLGLLRPNIYDY